MTCENPFGGGIFALGTTETDGGVFASGPVIRPMIQGNHVISRDSQCTGIGLAGVVIRAQVVANQIEGDGLFALGATQGFDLTEIARGNRFVANDLSGFSASLADVVLDGNTADTVVLGACDSVIDLGAGNRVSCGGGS